MGAQSFEVLGQLVIPILIGIVGLISMGVILVSFLICQQNRSYLFEYYNIFMGKHSFKFNISKITDSYIIYLHS